ncbi:hypothetical protein ANN_15850 [Periplaneta americana]|uniref:Uncharacterized protein n=1 Tax=Periplaneta americana TaxID=6978 RepID=A0ABQ8SHC7_PERAM|nr:hypothetical protein ANN_15850 [Periplaneta americana]
MFVIMWYVRNLIANLRETGSVHDADRPGRPSTATEIVDDIQVRILRSPQKSVRRLLPQANVAKSTVHDILTEVEVISVQSVCRAPPQR